MKNLWRSMAPFASDSTGACTVFSSSNALVIAQDSNGTASVLRRVINVNAARAAFETVDLPELSFTLGKERDFIERMVQIVDTVQADAARGIGSPVELVVLVNGPVSALLGADLAGRARKLEKAVGIKCMNVDTTGNAYYDKGLAAAYEAIYQAFVLPRAADLPERSANESVNIIGQTELDYPGAVLPNMLRAHLHDQGLQVATDFGASDSMEQWGRAAQASRNIVASASGLKLARKMKDELGTPYVIVCNTPAFDGLAAGLELACDPRVLIVGEQVTSNILRRLLRMAGATSVDVATFYTLDKEVLEQGDAKLKDEAGLRMLSSNYDVVIGDRMLARCCRPEETQVAFVDLMHPPTGFGIRDNTVVSRAWLEQLVFALNDAFGGTEHD